MTKTYRKLIDSLEALIAEVERETALIRSGNTKDLLHTAQAKRNAAEQYEAMAKSISDRQDQIGALGHDSRQKLARLTGQLNAALVDNTRVVAAAREASTRLIGRIIEAAGQRSIAGSYGEKGNVVVDANGLSAMRQRI